MKKRKLAAGGAIDPVAIANLLSQLTDAAGQDLNGQQTNTSAAASGALKGAGMGAQIGSVVPGIGTLIGGGVGAIIGGVSSFKRNQKSLEEFSKVRTKENQDRSKLLNQIDVARNANFNQGNSYQSYFKNGGKLPFSIIGDNTVKVKGKKHEDGGVKLGSVEVEKDEVIHDNKVFSARLKVPGTKVSFAEAAEELTEKPAYKTLRRKAANIEKGDSNLKMGLYQSGTMARNMQKTLGPLNNLFRLQEAQKSMRSTRKFAYGGTLDTEPSVITEGVKLYNKYKKPMANYLAAQQAEMNKRSGYTENNAVQERDNGMVMNPTAPNTVTKNTTNSPNIPFTGRDIVNKLGTAVPYVDNMVNAILTNKSPKVPAPEMEIAPVLKTKYNIQPQLAAMERNNTGVVRTLRDNVSDGSALRAALLGQGINNIEAKNQLLGQKENMETDLANKQAMVNADTANRNASIKSAYDLRKFGRNADQQTRISQNVANAVEDTQQGMIDRDLKNMSREDLELLLKKYSKSGVLARAGIKSK